MKTNIFIIQDDVFLIIQEDYNYNKYFYYT